MSRIVHMTNIEADLTTIPKRKLILHFDQHNTIQVASSLPDRHLTVEEGLNNFLTTACWGIETHDNEWTWVSDQPQMNKPINQPNAISYFKYLEKKIVKKPEDRPELKRQTSRFIYNEPGIKFKEFFDLYLQSLTYQKNYNPLTLLTNSENISDENDDPLGNSAETRHHLRLPSNTIIGGDPSNTSLYHLILPEFFDMIRRLQKEDREFTIILRTMGIDSQNFLDTVKPILEGKHRDFRDIKPIKINNQIGKIERGLNDKIALIIGDQVYDNDKDIYNKLCTLTGINAIRDDFAYWQKNDYECYAAKPLWINLNDPNNHHIIIDDNIRLNEVDDCIVNLRLSDGSNNVYENVDFNDYHMFDICCLVQPNLLELLNPHLKLDSKRNHYLDKIKSSERNFDRLLQDKESPCTHIKPNEEEPTNEKQNNFKSLPLNLPFILDQSNNHMNGECVANKLKTIRLSKRKKKEFLEKEEIQETDENKTITTTCCIQ